MARQVKKLILLLLLFGLFFCFSVSAWTVNQHTDNFGDYNGKYYLYDHGIQIELYKEKLNGGYLRINFGSSEYGYYQADGYKIELKEMDGTVHSYWNSVAPAFYGNKAEEIYDILLRNDTTKVFVYYSFGYGYSFTFEVQNSGLIDGIEQLRSLLGLPSLEEEEAIKAQEKAAEEAAEMEAKEKRKAFSTSSDFTLAVGIEMPMEVNKINSDTVSSSANALISLGFSKIVFKNGFVGGSLDASLGELGKEIGVSAAFGMGFKALHFGVKVPVRYSLDNSGVFVVFPQFFIEGFISFKKGGIVLGSILSIMPENANARYGLYFGYSLKSKEGSFATWNYK